MADREKVIKGLECCSQGATVPYIPTIRYCAECPYNELKMPCTRALARDALELLKEQEPVKPIVAVDTWLCSNCLHTLESQELIDDEENPQILVHEQYNFCPQCGKAVKWE